MEDEQRLSAHHFYPDLKNEKKLGQFNKHCFLLLILTLLSVKIEAIQKLEGIIHRWLF